MNKESSILLIVEGERQEKAFLDSLCKAYNIDDGNKTIYSYNTNIYELYERVFEPNLDELDSLDFLLTLKETSINIEQKHLITTKEYSDILLIFDYEPQDERFDVVKIKRMMEYFSESTENGKLYINYPMLEAYKHFCSIPNTEYLYRYVFMHDLVVKHKSQYKQIVNRESIITDLRKYDRELFQYIITTSLHKAELIQYGSYHEDVCASYRRLNHFMLLQTINEELKNKQKIPVLNTSLFFLCDYNIQLMKMDNKEKVNG